MTKAWSLSAGDVDADGAGGDLRAVQGAEGAAGGAVVEVEGDPGADDEDEAGEEVPELRVGEVEADGFEHVVEAEVGDLDAVGAAGQPGLVGEDHRDEDAEAEGGDGEVVALEAEDRAADEPGDGGGDGGAEDGGEAGVEAEVDRRERAGVGADPGEAGVAEADLAGVAGQDHDAGDGEAVDEDQRADAVVVVGGEEEGRGDDDDRQDEEGDALRGHGHTRSVDLRPKMPCGITKRTTRMTTKAAASL